MEIDSFELSCIAITLLIPSTSLYSTEVPLMEIDPFELCCIAITLVIPSTSLYSTEVPLMEIDPFELYSYNFSDTFYVVVFHRSAFNGN